MDALREAGVHAPVVVGGIIPDAGRAALQARQAWPPSTRRRTSTSPHHARHRGARSARPPRNGSARRASSRHAPASSAATRRPALGARLRERDLSAAPAALNLLESTAASDREQAARCCARSPPPRSAARPRARRRHHRAALARASRRCCRRSSARWREPGAAGGDARGRPELAPLGRLTARRPARIDFDPGDRGVFIRSTAAGERLGGLAVGDAGGGCRPSRQRSTWWSIETVGVGQAETEVAERGRHGRCRRPARRRATCCSS